MSNQVRAKVCFGLVALASCFISVQSKAATGRTVGVETVSASGEANYSIPIFVPPGINGLEPDLALTYGHRQPGGLIGVGWGVSGLSQISRCGKTVAQNGENSGVKLAVDDRYCLDGNQLRHQTGTYGAAFATYRTEIDLIARVTSMGVQGNGPQWFKVEAKDGLIYEYGNTADSRIESLAPYLTTTVRLWALSKVYDRSGNEIRFTYEEDGPPYGDFRIQSIEYRINPGAGVTTPGYSIDFIHGVQPVSDVDAGYGAGGEIEDVKRLTRIDVWTNDASPYLTRRYELDYEPTLSSTGRSRLSSVTECAGSPAVVCLSPTTFTYSNGANNMNSEVLSGTTVPGGVRARSLDINGDGRTDLVYTTDNTTSGSWVYRLANSSGTFDSAVPTGISGHDTRYAIGMDYNSDGIDDLLVPKLTGNWYAILGSESGGLQPAFDTGTAYEGTGGVDSAMAADVNGDGREDLVYKKSGQGIYARFRDPLGGFDATPTQIMDNTSNPKLRESYKKSRRFKFDANGDGVEDVIIITGCQTCPYKLWVIPGNDFTAVFHVDTLGSNGDLLRVLPLDINGDGYSDLAHKTHIGNIEYHLSTGTVLGPTVTIPSSADFDKEHMLRIDWNGDGLDDILVPNKITDTWFLIQSEGTGFAAPVDTGITEDVQAAGFKGGEAFWGDVDGDGLEDVVYQKADDGITNREFAYLRHSGVKPDLLESVTDGNGHVVEFEYAPITDSAVHTKQSNAVFPEQDYQQPAYVARQVERTTGDGGTYKTNYTYLGAKRNLEGRGLGGFKKRTIVDTRNGNKVVEKYKTEFPYRGRLAETQLFLSDSTLVQETDYAWWNKSGGSGYETYNYPYLRESIEKNFEAEGTYNGLQISEVTTTNTVDSYGNVTDSMTTTEEKASANGLQSGVVFTQQTIQSNITNNEAYWCHGKVGTIEQVNSHSALLPFDSQITRTTKLYWSSSALCRVDRSVVEPDSVHGGNSLYQVETELGYDAFGNVNSVAVTGKGMAVRTTTTYWGTTGQLPESTTNPLSQTTSRSWDYATGDLLSVTDPNSISVSAEYDQFGRQTRVYRSDGTYTDIDYTDCLSANNYCGTYFDRVKTKIHASSKSTVGAEIRYDDTYLDILDRAIQSDNQSLNGATVKRRLNFDAWGRVSRRYIPTFAVTPTDFETIEYDSVGRVKKVSGRINDGTASLKDTQILYEGLTTRTIDAEGNVTKKVSDVLGRMYRSIDADLHYQQFEYDVFGSLRRTIDSAFPSDPLMEATYEYGLVAYRKTMNDMDLGAGWTFSPNALGEVVSHTDANSQSFSAEFDKLGRPKTRTELEGTTTWTWGTSAGLHNIGKLESVSSPGHSESYLYDSYGRLTKTITVADTTYEFDYEYDAQTGLLYTTEYPVSNGSFRLKVRNEYQKGILKKVKRDDWNFTYWTANTEDAFGNVIDASLGNGVDVVRGYDAITGRLDYIQSDIGGGTALQDFEYAWDKVGNLIEREDKNNNLEEKFYYDSQNRLDSSELNLSANLDISYNDMGNILVKDDVSPSTWTYHTTKKHAVTSAGSNSYSYDNNGNMITRKGDDITWTSYNYPAVIEDGSKNYEFAYDANRQLWKQVFDDGTDIETTVFVGGLYEKNIHSTDTEHRHYIVARGQAVALYIDREQSYANTQYFLRDYQGSIASILTSAGVSKVDENFSAFGERRNPATWAGGPTQSDLNKIADRTDRGYTDHLHLEESSLIHMKGRVMDAEIGRFLSPDPFVFQPGNTQNFNRYSYVNNNPMSYTDPSGFCVEVVCISAVGYVLNFFGAFGFGSDPKPPPPDWCAIGGAEGCIGAVIIHLSQFNDDVVFLTHAKEGTLTLEDVAGFCKKPGRSCEIGLSPGGEPRFSAETFAFRVMIDTVFNSAAASASLKAISATGSRANATAVLTAPSTTLESVGSNSTGPLTTASGTLDDAAALARTQPHGVFSSIQFGRVSNQTNHAFRHTDAAGLARSDVQAAITRDLTQNAASIQNGLNIRTVVVDGVELTVNSFRLPSGTINVGRITTPR